MIELAVETSPCTTSLQNTYNHQEENTNYNSGIIHHCSRGCRTMTVSTYDIPLLLNNRNTPNMYDQIFDVAHARRTERSHSFMYDLIFDVAHACRTGHLHSVNRCGVFFNGIEC